MYIVSPFVHLDHPVRQTSLFCTYYSCHLMLLSEGDAAWLISQFTCVFCLFRGSSHTDGPSHSSVLFSKRWVASCRLRLRFARDMAAQHCGWPQAGEDMHQKRDVYWTQVCSCNYMVCLFVSVCQASDITITAICSMPDNQFAVSFMKPAVDVLKLVWNQQHSTAR